MNTLKVNTLFTFKYLYKYDWLYQGYAVAKNEKVIDEETKENAVSAMEGCPTDAISEEK